LEVSRDSVGIGARLPYCEIPSTDLRSACRLRVSSAVALLGISLLRFVTEDDPSLTLHKKALQPLSLRREPTQKSCFPRPKNVFVQQTWFIFYGRALPCQPAVCFFPFSLAVILGKHTTATVTCCLHSSGWVATTYILHVFLLEKQ
jgi:hypothetical protein